MNRVSDGEVLLMLACLIVILFSLVKIAMATL